jgi:hypothetical protein
MLGQFLTKMREQKLPAADAKLEIPKAPIQPKTPGKGFYVNVYV